MRSVFYFLLLLSLIIVSSCSPSDEYRIHGTVPSDNYDGEWVYFLSMDSGSTRVDSTMVHKARFSFTGRGEEMKLLLLRPALRVMLQDLIFVSEPGDIYINVGKPGSAQGTPQNDALQQWKVKSEEMRKSIEYIEDFMPHAGKEDSAMLMNNFHAIKRAEQERNYQLLKQQSGTTLGRFLWRTLSETLSEEQREEILVKED